MFEVGELIRRKTISDGKTQALCVIVKKSEDNYIIYNNSLQTIQKVANVVIEALYTRHTWVCLGGVWHDGYVTVFVIVW